MDRSNSINFRQDHFSSRMVSTLPEVGSFCHFFYKCCVTHSPYFSDLYLTSSQNILVVYVYPSLYVLTLNIIMVMRKSWPKPKKISFLCFPHDHHCPIQSLVQHLRATFQHNSLRQKAHCQPHLTQAICIIVNLPPAIIEDYFSSIE